MKKSIMAAIFSIFAVISLTSCKGNENNTEKAEVTSTEAVVSSENEETIAVPEKSTENLEKVKKNIKSNSKNTPVQTTAVQTKTAEEEKKIFNISGSGMNVYLTSDWVYQNADEPYLEEIEKTPAILMYKTNVDNCTVLFADGCETEEEFANNTEESYISAYGSQFESINITSFESLEIDGLASFKIIADVKIGGKDVKMMHIISNSTVKNKTISVMLIDTDGETVSLFDNFEENNIYYSETLSTDFRIKTGDDMNSVKERFNERKRRLN